MTTTAHSLPSIHREFFGPGAPLAEYGDDPYLAVVLSKPAFRILHPTVVFNTILTVGAFFLLGSCAAGKFGVLVLGILAMLVFLCPIKHLGTWTLLGRLLLHRCLRRRTVIPSVTSSIVYRDPRGLHEWRLIPLGGGRGAALLLAESIHASANSRRFRLVLMVATASSTLTILHTALRYISEKPIFTFAVPMGLAIAVLLFGPSIRYASIWAASSQFRTAVGELCARTAAAGAKVPFIYVPVARDDGPSGLPFLAYASSILLPPLLLDAYRRIDAVLPIPEFVGWMLYGLFFVALLLARPRVRASGAKSRERLVGDIGESVRELGRRWDELMGALPDDTTRADN